MSLQVLGPSVLGREDGAYLLKNEPVVDCWKFRGAAQFATSVFNPGHELVPCRRKIFFGGVVTRINNP